MKISRVVMPIILALVAMLSVPLGAGESGQPVLPEVGWRIVSVSEDGSGFVEVPSRGRVPVIPEVLNIGPSAEDARAQVQTMTSSASFDPAFQLELAGIEYTIAVDKNTPPRIKYIATEDTVFRTPEGVRVGESIAALLAVRGREFMEETGWACFVCLESGWAAGFPVLDEANEWIECSSHSLRNAKVSWLFKRRATCVEQSHITTD